MKFMLSKTSMVIAGMFFLLIKFVFFFDIDVLPFVRQIGSSAASLTGHVISLTMFLTMIGVVAYVLSRGLLETEA